jgi:hypothetical protein
LEERKKNVAQGACYIFGSGTLQGHNKRNYIGTSDWAEAKAVADQSNAAGSWVAKLHACSAPGKERLSARPSDPVARLLLGAGATRVLRAFFLAGALHSAISTALDDFSVASFDGFIGKMVLSLSNSSLPCCRTCGFRLLRPDCRFRLQSVMRSPGSCA